VRATLRGVLRLAIVLLAVLGPAGGWATQAAAAELPLGSRSLDERRAGATVAPGVRWTRIVREGGPWRVNVLSVAPGVRLLAVPGGDAVGERARPSALARAAGAVAAVNGGYFAGDGNPVGVLAAAGRLLSEPVGGRSALVLGLDPLVPARVLALRFAGAATLAGTRLLLDGVNRAPGVVPACGGRGGDRPGQRADAVTTCTDPSELVAFTPDWGAPTPRRAAGASPRADAAVRGGVVTSVRPNGGTQVPPDGVVLAGTGEAARLLRAMEVGAPLELAFPLRGAGAVLAPESLAAAIGGGPRLVARGRVRVRASAEGFAPLSAPWFYGSFVAGRHPRTLAGVRADGRLLLVTVDGRQPGWSAGVTLPEAARVMRSLGARDALNLDGGGSTAMAVRGRTVNRPSDRGGERRVSDALVVLP
jgi:Phosphodiester glycosidase